MDIASLTMYSEAETREWLLGRGMHQVRQKELAKTDCLLYVMLQQHTDHLKAQGKWFNALLISAPVVTPHDDTATLKSAGITNSYIISPDLPGPVCVFVNEQTKAYQLRGYNNIFLPDPTLFPIHDHPSTLGPITYARPLPKKPRQTFL